ncbi:MAG TPA: serine hydrolase, partial [Sediminibacterium sp.]|nr:serine hydrolase [Sediminibacterium sp.]
MLKAISNFMLACLMLFTLGCNKTNLPPASSGTTMYFPSNTDANWETKSLESLGWNQTAATALKTYLTQKNTKSFMILVNGRIVMEEYFNGHSQNATWQWNSAGKTLVASTTGIAQQEGLLNINNKVSQYLGIGWTSEPIDKENLISSKHLLTMTSGIDDGSELIIKQNLTYLADAGSRWSYHNVFQRLMDVVASASKQDFET